MGLTRGNGNQHIAPVRHFAAGLACQPDCRQPRGPGYAQGCPDVHRIA
jgi:hypothetical protein